MSKQGGKLNHKNFFLYKDYQRSYKKLNLHREDFKSKKEQELEEYQKSSKELDVLKDEYSQIEQQKEKVEKDNEEKLNQINDSIEQLKLENELEELKKMNNLKEIEYLNKKDLEILVMEYEGNVNEAKKGNQLAKECQEKSNEIASIELKYKYLQNKVVNDKEFDELIKLVEQRKNEIINNELEYFQEQKDELNNFKQETEKRLSNLREKNNLEIQKKQLELKNYKILHYNKLLLEKKKLINDFKNVFSANSVSNQNLKNKEIEKARAYFNQQKNNLLYRENIFNQQKGNINALIKQLEINGDEYSQNLKQQLNP